MPGSIALKRICGLWVFSTNTSSEESSENRFREKWRMEASHWVEDWLSARAEAPKTRTFYEMCWKQFTKFCMERGKDPLRLVEDYRAARIQGEVQRQTFLEGWQDILRAFNTWLKKKEYAPFSMKNFLVVVKSFVGYWKIPLDVDLPRHPYVIYHNRDLTKEDIRLILSRGTPRDRVIWLIMAESGLRANTAITIKYWQIKDDLEKDIIPMRVLTPAESLKDHVGPRWSFLGEDGARALKEYLKPRMPLKEDDYIFLSERPQRMKGDIFTVASISVKFARVVRKLDFERGAPPGKPGRVRMHSLRAYFRNNCHAEAAFREFWMGHSLGVDAHYLTRDPEIHRKEYARNYEGLRIVEPTTPTGLKEIQEQLSKKDKEIEELRAQIQELRDSSQAIDDLMKTTGLLEKNKREILEYLIKLLNQVGKGG
jgi:integrase